nr:MAG TPA: hypothetical protein [Caudoviricetes sp.]
MGSLMVACIGLSRIRQVALTDKNWSTYLSLVLPKILLIPHFYCS